MRKRIKAQLEKRIKSAFGHVLVCTIAILFFLLTVYELYHGYLYGEINCLSRGGSCRELIHFSESPLKFIFSVFQNVFYFTVSAIFIIISTFAIWEEIIKAYHLFIRPKQKDPAPASNNEVSEHSTRDDAGS